MCGIAGEVRFGGAFPAPGLINSLTRGLKHRGPDSDGTLVKAPVSFGHTRLSFVDLLSGNQPLELEDYPAAITFNGELYNYREVRSTLTACGHRFRTSSEAEIIMRSWIEWREGCLARLRGMFAFAVSDWRLRKVFLARDHFGMKPLCYFFDDERFIFSSEVGPLVGALAKKPALEPGSVLEFLRTQAIAAPRTIYQTIYKLPAAHSLTVTFDGVVGAPTRYWRLSFENTRRRSQSDYEDEIDSLLRASVAEQLAGCEPATFLSGGIDSSLVTAVAKHSGRPVQSFSAAFPGSSVDESGAAKAMSRALSVSNHTVEITDGSYDRLAALLDAFGEPFGDESALAASFLAEEARRDTRMVLSGDGADEAFLGYDAFWRWNAIAVGQERTLADWVRCTHTYFTDETFADIINEKHFGCDFTEGGLAGTFASSSDYSPLNQAQLIRYERILPDIFLRKVDITAMQFGLEVRMPFLDLRLVEAAASIPSDLHFKVDGAGRHVGKQILINLLRRYCPTEVPTPVKKGFSLPLYEWFGPKGLLRRELERITDSGAEISRFVRIDAVRALVLRRTPHPKAVWLLLVLETWLEGAAH
jgi:asparagine synthase (glutamine-hydrolysing)